MCMSLAPLSSGCSGTFVSTATPLIGAMKHYLFYPTDRARVAIISETTLIGLRWAAKTASDMIERPTWSEQATLRMNDLWIASILRLGANSLYRLIASHYHASLVLSQSLRVSHPSTSFPVSWFFTSGRRRLSLIVATRATRFREDVA